MPSLIETLSGQLLGGQLDSLSSALGTDRNQTQNAVAQALPVLLGALAKNASRPEGANSLLGALQRDHDGSLLDNLGAFLKKPDLKDGNGILRHTLGGRRDTLEGGLSRASGMDPQKIKMLMAMLAPVVMAALGRARRERQMDATSLSGLLRGERESIERSAPEMGLLGSLLDQDGDGQIVDDVLGKVGRGLLGSLLNKPN